MNEIYNKFKKLPSEIKQAVASRNALEILDEIEDKYSINLMEVVFGVATKDIKSANLENFFQEEYDMEIKKAEDLARDLKEKIFKPILGYLEGEEIKKINEEEKDIEEIEKLKEKVKDVKPLGIEKLINEISQKCSLSFEDEVLDKRFRNIISARLKGIRDKVEIKEVLMRPKKVGGLELGDEQAEGAAKIIEQEFKKIEENLKQEIKIPAKFEIGKEFKTIAPKMRDADKSIEALSPPDSEPKAESAEDKNISEVLALTIDEAIGYFDGQYRITDKLKVLRN